MALAHNGNLVNANPLKYQLEAQGSIFQTTSDTEAVAHLIKRGGFLKLEDRVRHALSMVKGAYAFVMMTEDKMIAAQDPHGIRPLSLGRLGDGYVIASETCALDIVGARFERVIQPGEMVIIDEDGCRSEMITHSGGRKICSIEYIYFSRPDSNIDEINVHTARKNLGNN